MPVDAPERETETRSMIEALIALQSALPVVLKDSENPHFRNKYASLHAIHRAVFPILAEHGFAWVTEPTFYEGREEPLLRYTLTHISGKVAATGGYPLPSGLDPQKLGAAITYGRRFSLCAVLGIVADDDDDAEAVAAPQRAAQPVTAPSRAIGQGPPGTEAKPASDNCADCAALGWHAQGKDGKKWAAKFWPDSIKCNGRSPDGGYANHPRPVEDLPDAIYDDTDVPF